MTPPDPHTSLLTVCQHFDRSVEFHDPGHGFRTLALSPGDYVHFPPMVMHRLVSDDGGLTILGMMGNAGLAERGEARIYFGPEVDAEAEAFAALVALPKREGLEGALKRRDAAVTGYQHLLGLWEHDRAAYVQELGRFFAVHGDAMAEKADELSQQVDAGPMAWARETQSRIAGLPACPDVQTDVHRTTAATRRRWACAACH